MRPWRRCKAYCWSVRMRERVAAKGHGKRGGARMIYYWVVAHDRILLLDIYAKNEKEDLSAAELKLLRTLIKGY